MLYRFSFWAFLISAPCVMLADVDGPWWLEGGRGITLSTMNGGCLTVAVDANANTDESGRTATFWMGNKLPAEFVLTCEATVLESVNLANNVNFFLHYKESEGDLPLIASRDSRSEAVYRDYHQLDGYIITWVNDWTYAHGTREEGMKGRLRIRRCPGFELLAERLIPQASEIGRAYAVEITCSKRGIVVDIDGKWTLEARDDSLKDIVPGLLGLRTFSSRVEWSNLQVQEFSNIP